jgi:diaminopimelate dehydrogenase
VPRDVSVCDAGSLPELDVALVCVPTACGLDLARELLSRGVPIVEAAQLHAQAARAHREALDHEARRQRRPAVVGAGWDPGALQALRGWFTLAPRATEARAPRRASTTRSRRAAPGVRDAL